MTNDPKREEEPQESEASEELTVFDFIDWMFHVCAPIQEPEPAETENREELD